jgi:hypothetical protein
MATHASRGTMVGSGAGPHWIRPAGPAGDARAGAMGCAARKALEEAHREAGRVPWCSKPGPVWTEIALVQWPRIAAIRYADP